MDLRVSNYFDRINKVNISVNNKEIEAYEGECLAVVLFVNNIKKLRLSPKKKQGRGMFCLMGSFLECVVLINDKKGISCNVFIEDGMKIKVGDFDK